ncbi:Aste57867_2060 [Aphanomyces stellatus]|uniref:Aste57867_2060 protein n=1 Tax=Aphanomyces stellatus TaxID=120398 RepID=A0A485KBT5_9STRA|nr:hypothetical protein As57867_002056 [Aphanomyces stellatus]VFT79264.1 Aste57867_2060 [Aphanomyces stellatus]
MPTFAFCPLFVAAARACSDFLLNTTTNQVMSARAMHFPSDLHFAVEIVPRHTLVQDMIAAKCPDCPDVAWRTTYGFVAINAFGLNAATDGLNEKGLSAGFLMLELSNYPRLNVSDARPIVASLVAYILSNVATADQVMDGLKRIQVDQFDMAVLGLLPRAANLDKPLDLHLPIHDASGHSIVVECLNGTLNVYDNPNGVLTNEPLFEEQRLLVQALHSTQHDMVFDGGYDPIERFQRLTILNRHAHSLPSSSRATPDQAPFAAAVRTINTVAIPTAYVDNPMQYTVVQGHVNRRALFQHK